MQSPNYSFSPFFGTLFPPRATAAATLPALSSLAVLRPILAEVALILPDNSLSAPAEASIAAATSLPIAATSSLSRRLSNNDSSSRERLCSSVIPGSSLCLSTLCCSFLRIPSSAAKPVAATVLSIISKLLNRTRINQKVKPHSGTPFPTWIKSPQNQAKTRTAHPPCAPFPMRVPAPGGSVPSGWQQ
ncbi:hypothetical protein SDC9_123679 [bioreactor metagenome]|uniref:Uncharacterized protein n=1 Tax=bioreactor metagenome TaxID=1076179 RepID=A0A645CIB7_9ZZZZ